ncbi:hypothetical protein CK203_008485 [Vitis vinifera]|uniref:Uncharacterized protein n=1 Tax=Vitis vinifera TaxID=29760 RepID=A0A438KNF6_VITVI|nr:hypothetical protein CK203_008485 [Vitis vinifera]
MSDQSEAIREERLSLEISVARELGTMRSPWVNKKFLGVCKKGALSNSRKDRELKKLFSSIYEGNIGKEVEDGGMVGINKNEGDVKQIVRNLGVGRHLGLGVSECKGHDKRGVVILGYKSIGKDGY